MLKYKVTENLDGALAWHNVGKIAAELEGFSSDAIATALAMFAGVYVCEEMGRRTAIEKAVAAIIAGDLTCELINSVEL